MAKRLKRGESGTAGVRRVLRRETAKARRSVPPDALRAKPIHDARKHLKKARAALRLVRDALSPGDYLRENRRLRDAARPLSAIRDAEVPIDALEGLARRAGHAHRRAFGVMRARLGREQRSARRRFHDEDLARTAVKRIGRSRRWASVLSRHRGWSVLGRGLGRVYRSGRDALAAAREAATTEHLHECRKQTKYLWHQLQLLEAVRPRPMKRLAHAAHGLSDRLGNDHDLAVLREKVEAARRVLPRDGLRRILRMIADERGDLQRRAFAIATRLYAAPPSRFVARVERWWRVWRSRR